MITYILVIPIMTKHCNDKHTECLLCKRANYAACFSFIFSRTFATSSLPLSTLLKLHCKYFFAISVGYKNKTKKYTSQCLKNG